MILVTTLMVFFGHNEGNVGCSLIYSFPKTPYEPCGAIRTSWSDDRGRNAFTSR